MKNYHAEIFEAIEEIGDVPAGVTLNGDTRFEEDLAFDSGSFIELFLIIEESVPGFTLGAARLAPEDFTTVNLLGQFIARRMAELTESA
ncbi:MAG: hypothetical protein JJU24_10540 [Natronohydrobacter sp.]|nr:hypothetical protein [Natronohydrobacter sp.]